MLSAIKHFAEFATFVILFMLGPRSIFIPISKKIYFFLPGEAVTLIVYVLVSTYLFCNLCDVLFYALLDFVWSAFCITHSLILPGPRSLTFLCLTCVTCQ